MCSVRRRARSAFFLADVGDQRRPGHRRGHSHRGEAHKPRVRRAAGRIDRRRGCRTRRSRRPAPARSDAELAPTALSQHLPYVAATNLLRCHSEPAPVRFIDPDVTGVGVDEGQQRRHRVGHELELPLALPERVGLPTDAVTSCRTWTVRPSARVRLVPSILRDEPSIGAAALGPKILQCRPSVPPPVHRDRAARDGRSCPASFPDKPPAGVRAARPPRRSARRSGQRGPSTRPRPATPRQGRLRRFGRCRRWHGSESCPGRPRGQDRYGSTTACS